MFVEVHFLQNFAPSNLNRDDTGNPKDAEFGGVRRARISSQAIKRAIRLEPIFAEITKVPPAVRTRWMTRRLAEKLVAAGKPQEDAETVARAFAAAFSGKMDKDKADRTSVLLYLSDEEYASMAQTLLSQWDMALDAALKAAEEAEDKNKKKDSAKGKRKSKSPFEILATEWIKKTKGRTSAPDIALFGRMLADKPELNLDAACQVAHAISTHRVDMDFDFFTAVDDLLTDEEAGAGMMGVTPFNSATYYRYARIDWEQLVKNLGGDTELACRTVEGFLRAALRAIPTGKQNAFAAQNPPDFALAVVRKDGMAWSLANAFERPVRPNREGGLMEPSIQALDAYWGRLTQVYGAEGVYPFAFCVRDPDGLLTHLQTALQPNVETWIQAVLAQLPTATTKEA
ncbi:MAG TPA: type I-E CRISPR-associated protein Cas7/Cse4/CasC [Anaerolineae bacterium]|nr:type I-E CRISPR-associated protein Cas7/Cse4/CasC [Anaerolineae bacterium]